ncbi:MAG: hypothetical protein FJZ01_27175 [Candidatus Sericytochromatia bacterium]|nr:hypothetical protein [Candidatus Tanganyikabacteria bacterium]
MLQSLRGLGRALGEALNGVSARLLGRDQGFRYGVAGLTRLPALSRDELRLSAGAARRLASSRVFLLHGTPWPGVGSKGGSWLAPWAARLEELGVGRAVPIEYSGRSTLWAHVKLLLEPLFHFDEKRVLKQISADLAARPLAKGEHIALIGHSYGTRLSVPVADKLRARGLPVSTVVMIENRVPAPIGQFVKQAPAVPRVLEIENNPGKPLRTAAGTAYKRIVAPDLTHMDFVLSPPARILEGIVKELAAR